MADMTRDAMAYFAAVAAHNRRLIATNHAHFDRLPPHLACWCKPDCPCHADVLLEIANG